MSDTPTPQTVGLAFKEIKLLASAKDKEPVHIEIDISLNFVQREVYNLIIRLTKSDNSLRTYLIGVFLSFGAGPALNELRKNFPKMNLSLSNISQSL